MSQDDPPAPGKESKPEPELPETESELTARLTRSFQTEGEPDVDLEHRTATTWERLKKLQSQSVSGSRYVLKGEVGRGGMGSVLKVFDSDLRRNLAMKVILGNGPTAGSGGVPEVATERLTRFIDEAQVTGQLDHPGVVPVHELGVDSEGRVYFTMRLVKGIDLKRVFELVHDGKEGWTTPRALGVLLKVCEAMSFAHDKGVVHRDLKPANVMVGKYGEVYVMDWGLARVEGREDSRNLRLGADTSISLSELVTDRGDAKESGLDSPVVTMDGTVVGTPFYMPPEQAEGRVDEVGARSDVYALGAMLYHLLTSQLPYLRPGSRPSPHTILAAVMHGPPTPVLELAPDTPAELAAICEKAMRRDAADRYADMGELAEDLRAFLEDRVVSAYRTGPIVELRKWVRRNRTLAATSTVALVTVVAVLSISSFWLKKERDESERQRHGVLGLSAFRDYERQVADARSLWPPHPERLQDLRDWMKAADGLVATLRGREEDYPGHYAMLAELESRALTSEETSLERSLRFANDADDWWHGQLSELVRMIEDLSDPETGLMGSGLSVEHGWGMGRRIAAAERLKAGFAEGGEFRHRWEAAGPAIAARYPDLELSVQMGLVPIGPDANTGLWEFWHVLSGDEPLRNEDTGGLELTEESGIVLVLLPGATFWMGAQSTDRSKPNYEARVEKEELAHKVTLSAFFLSKYELTQAQWKRLTGNNPSGYGPDGQYDPKLDAFGTGATLLHPVELVSWLKCRQVLAWMGLGFPSEAQWEYGSRGGTESSWWTGQEKETLVGAANLADRYGRPPGIVGSEHDWLNDGYVVHAPVDSFRANGFGLHNVVGNVWEWCMDGYDEGFYGVSPEENPVGPEAGSRVIRGGGYRDFAFDARSARRNDNDPADPHRTVGVRPARGIH